MAILFFPTSGATVSIENLDKIFAPRRIAVFGASNKPTSVGFTVFRNLIGSGFTGVVYPVNPKHESVQGVPAYTDPSQLPQIPDLAVICTPAPTVPGIVRVCGELGTRGILIISAGFRETGPEGYALEEEILVEQKKFKGMRTQNTPVRQTASGACAGQRPAA